MDAYEEEDKFAIERLSGVNLQSDYINPFYDAVIAEINDTDICSYRTSTVRLIDKSSLVTPFGVEYDISEGYWIFNGDDSIIKGVSLGRYTYDLSKASKSPQ